MSNRQTTKQTIHNNGNNNGNVDYDFNYNGVVNFEKKPIYDKYDAQLEKINSAVFLDGKMSLEPRLQEYLRKKIFYKRGGMQPQIKLSKSYQITPQDRIIMKQFLSGKTNIYSKANNVNSNTNQNKPKEKFVFLADQLKGDKRVPKIDYEPNRYKTAQHFQKETKGMFGNVEANCVTRDENIDMSGILDSRDFMELSAIDERYRKGSNVQGNNNDSRRQVPHILPNSSYSSYSSQNNEDDRFKLAKNMFNQSGRV